MTGPVAGPRLPRADARDGRDRLPLRGQLVALGGPEAPAAHGTARRAARQRVVSPSAATVRPGARRCPARKARRRDAWTRRMMFGRQRRSGGRYHQCVWLGGDRTAPGEAIRAERRQPGGAGHGQVHRQGAGVSPGRLARIAAIRPRRPGTPTAAASLSRASLMGAALAGTTQDLRDRGLQPGVRAEMTTGRRSVRA